MSFFAGAVIAKAIMDTTGWTKGTNSMNSSMGGMGKAFGTLAKVGTAAIAAIGTALVTSIMKANEWQKEFANVTTLVDTTKVNTQEMARQLLELDSRLGSTTDLTKGLYQALSASVDPAHAVEFVGQAAQFAKAALVDTNTAVDVITTGLNAYGLEADKATDISDKLFSVIKLGKTTGAELSSTIGQSIPLAANMGVSFDELGASIAIMTRQGINAANATTQFNAIINAFLKPSSEMESTLKGMGYESGSAAIEALGFKGALEAVTESTGGSKDKMAELFSNTRALRGAMALTGEGAGDFDEVLGEITNSAGATNIAFNKQEVTFETLKNTLEKGQIVVGNIGKVFADEIAVGATEAANGMIQFLMSSQGAELVSNIIGHVAAAFETLKVILQPLIDVILTHLKTTFDNIVETLKKVFGKAEDGVGAFNALSFAVQFLSSIMKVMSTIVNTVISTIGDLIVAIKASGGVIGSFFDFLTGKKSWDEVKEQAKTAGDAFAALGKGIVGGFKDVFNIVFDEAKTFGERVQGQAKNIEVTYKTTFKNVSESTKKGYESMITGQQDFVGAIELGAQQISDIFQNTNNEDEQDTNKILQTKKQLWDQYYAELKDKVKSNTEFQIEMSQVTIDALTEGFQTSFEALGEFFVKGEEASKQFWETIASVAKETIAKILEALAQEFIVRSIAAFVPGPTFNPVAGAGYAAAAAAAYIAAGAIRALQGGGSVGMFEPVLVGERGPELFIPNTPGQVIPNNQIGNVGRNVTINNYNTIGNASDAELLSTKMALKLRADKRTV